MRLTLGISITAMLSLGAQALEAPIEGYTVHEMEWEVEHSPGQKLRARGTVEEVLHHVQSVNPDYRAREIPVRRRGSKGSLAKRENKNPPPPGMDHRVCYPDTGPADGNDIYTGVSYLKGIDGKPSNGPGPGSCGRVSCSENSAIWWCNDSTETKTLDSFTEIADAADYLCTDCWMSAAASNTGFGNMCGGQVFMKDDWNVMIRDASC